MHGLQLLEVDILAGTFDDAVGLFGGFQTGVFHNLVARKAGIAEHLVALQLGFLQQVLVVSDQQLHLLTGFFGGIEGVCDGFFTILECFQEHGPTPFA